MERIEHRRRRPCHQVPLHGGSAIHTSRSGGNLTSGAPDASAYTNRIRAREAVIRESLERAPGPDVIARAILRALTDRRPRVRYAAGPSSWLVPIARRLLPDVIGLRLIRSHFRI